MLLPVYVNSDCDEREYDDSQVRQHPVGLPVLLAQALHLTQLVEDEVEDVAAENL